MHFVLQPEAGELHPNEVGDGRQQDSLFGNRRRRKTGNRFQMVWQSLLTNEQEMDRAPWPLTNPCVISVAKTVVSRDRCNVFEIVAINRHVNIPCQSCGQWIELIDV